MLVVDLEGFMVPQFIPKEMAITDGERTAHYVFKPPFPFRELEPRHQCAVKYFTKNRHGIPWHTGSVDVSEIGSILRHVGERDKVIFCKGKVLECYLKQHTKLRVLNMDNDSKMATTEEIQDWKPPCFAHNLNMCRCALNTVTYLYNKLSNK